MNEGAKKAPASLKDNQPKTGVVAMKPIGDSSPRFTARMGGVFYLLMAVSGGLATFARRGLIVGGDAATTAANILAHQSMYLLAFAGDLLVVASYLAVTALFYRMLKPVSRSVSLTAAYFSLMGCAIQGFALSFQLAPLTVLGGARYLGVFTVEQLQALAYMFLKLYSQAYGIAIVFFGFFCLLTGYLAFKSTFLPRILGGLMMLAGLSWLTFLSPLFAAKYFPYILAGAVGEGLFPLWLLVKGVDAERWKQQAGAARRAEPT
jgi:hypothetical protein